MSVLGLQLRRAITSSSQSSLVAWAGVPCVSGGVATSPYTSSFCRLKLGRGVASWDSSAVSLFQKQAPSRRTFAAGPSSSWEHAIQDSIDADNHATTTTTTTTTTKTPKGDVTDLNNLKEIARKTRGAHISVTQIVDAMRAGKQNDLETGASILWTVAEHGDDAKRGEICANALDVLVGMLKDPINTTKFGLQCAAAALSCALKENKEFAEVVSRRREAVRAAGALEPIVQMLQSGDARCRLDAAGLLVRMVADAKFVDEVIAVGALDPLVAILHVDDEGLLTLNDVRVVASAAMAVANIASHGDKYRAALVDCGALPPLVAILRFGDVHARANAATALANFSCGSTTCREALRQAGAFEVLVDLVHDKDDRFRKQVSRALSGWVGRIKDAASDTTRRDDVNLEDLATLMQKGDQSHKETSAAVLWAIARTSNGLRRDEIIAADGVIDVLVSLLHNGSDFGRTSAAGALSNIIKGTGQYGDRRREVVLAAGALAPLLSLAQTGNEMAKEQATAALLNIAKGGGTCRDTLEKADAFDILRKIVESNEFQKPMQAWLTRTLSDVEQGDPIDVMKQASRHANKRDEIDVNRLVNLMKQGNDLDKETGASTLWAIAQYSDGSRRDEICAVEGLLGVLVDMMNEGSVYGKAAAVGALANISNGRGLSAARRRLEILNAGALPPLVALAYDDNPNLTEQAASALAKLAADSVGASAIVEAGALDPLRKILSKGENIRAMASVAMTVANLAVHGNDMKQAVVDAGIMPPLLDMLRTGGMNEFAQNCAVMALANMARGDESYRQVLEDAGALQLLNELVTTSSWENVRNNARRAIRFSTGEEELVDDHVDYAAIVDKMLNDSDVDRMDGAAMCKQVLSSAQRDALVYAGAAPPLIALLRDGSVEGKTIAATAVAELLFGFSETRPQAFIDAGVVEPLVALLRGENGYNDTDGKIRAASAIERLTYRNASRGDAFVQSGACDTLVALLSDDSDSMQYRAAKALLGISSSTAQNREAVIRADPIRPLVGLLRDGATMEIKTEAAAVLAQLLYRNSQAVEQAVDAGAIPLISSLLLDAIGAKTQSRALLVLSHIANVPSSTYRNAIMDNNAVVEHLVALLDSDDDNTTKSAARTLSSLTYQDYGRIDGVVSAGAVQALVSLFKKSDVSGGVLSHACVTLANIAESTASSHLAIMMEAGAATVLEPIARDDNTAKSKDARYILECLAVHSNNEGGEDGGSSGITPPQWPS